MGHIQLSREADLLVVAPATADLMAKMAAGLADDLATTALLATDKPVLIAPAMNVRMWEHPATQRNLARSGRRRAVRRARDGEMACGEFGSGPHGRAGRDPRGDRGAFCRRLADKPLAGRRALVTAGPTHEPIDPVRYLANRSSGKQGHAIAAALAALGAETTLVSGPVDLSRPPASSWSRSRPRRRCWRRCEAALPVDVAVMRGGRRRLAGRDQPGQKMKKATADRRDCARREPGHPRDARRAPAERPRLVVGFAAETENVVANAKAKLARKGCDWIVANDVGPG